MRTISTNIKRKTIADRMITERFLRQSNAIEDVYDEDSYKQAKKAWEYLQKQNQLDREVILKTHKILMVNQDLKPDEKGYFRKRPVYIGGREGMQYPYIKTTIDTWCMKANLVRTKKQIKQDHIHYENIHPFIDGNGRTGRLFLNWQRVRNGFDILVIESVLRNVYYEWFA